MRVRTTNGFSYADQFRVLADISDDYGKVFGDLTARQQLQLREFGIDDVPISGTARTGWTWSRRKPAWTTFAPWWDAR